MRIGLAYGRDHWEGEIAPRQVVAVRRQPAAPPLADPAAAVSSALEKPLGFPALRQALTPDDHIAIVVDEQLPHLAQLLIRVVEHLRQARIVPGAVTLVCPPPSTGQPWLEDLPDFCEDMHLEVHDPADRKKLSYLATTRQGRRVYLNRTVVDADQVVVLSGRGYHPVLGYSGAETSLYPALSDEAARREAASNISMKPPGAALSGLRRQAAEVAWLLGVPFLVQVIEGAEGAILHVLGGPAETSGDGQKLQDARWHVEVARAADLVVAGIAGAAASFADLARALGCAARVVQPHGRIVLLAAGAPDLGQDAEPLRQAETPEAVLHYLRQHPSFDMDAPFQWASAARQATLYLFSQLPAQTAEDLFTVPMDHAGQLQRLLEAAETCLFLPDAHKTMAVVKAG